MGSLAPERKGLLMSSKLDIPKSGMSSSWCVKISPGSVDGSSHLVVNVGTGEHVLWVTHAALRGLVLPAELRLVLEVVHLDTAVLGRVSLGAGVGRVAVGWQDSSLQTVLGRALLRLLLVVLVHITSTVLVHHLTEVQTPVYNICCSQHWKAWCLTRSPASCLQCYPRCSPGSPRRRGWWRPGGRGWWRWHGTSHSSPSPCTAAETVVVPAATVPVLLLSIHTCIYSLTLDWSGHTNTSRYNMIITITFWIL